MVLIRSPAMLLAFVLIPWLLQSSGASFDEARALDSLLQDYAFRAFVQPRTGIAFDGRPPSNLSGVAISVMRVRSGSLRRRGVSSYKEFVIPTGVIVKPHVERLALVYQNLGNWSTVYYPLSGYDYIAPVVGLLSYSAFNLSVTNLQELYLRPASGQPISIRFSQVKPVAVGASCVTFDLHGTVKFSNVSSGNVCSTVEQGHFAIVIKSPAPAPHVPLPAPPSPSKKGGKDVVFLRKDVLFPRKDVLFLRKDVLFRMSLILFCIACELAILMVVFRRCIQWTVRRTPVNRWMHYELQFTGNLAFKRPILFYSYSNQSS